MMTPTRLEERPPSRKGARMIHLSGGGLDFSGQHRHVDIGARARTTRKSVGCSASPYNTPLPPHTVGAGRLKETAGVSAPKIFLGQEPLQQALSALRSDLARISGEVLEGQRQQAAGGWGGGGIVFFGVYKCG